MKKPIRAYVFRCYLRTSEQQKYFWNFVSVRKSAGYCSDFRNESNGIFVLGVGFFFFRQISTF